MTALARRVQLSHDHLTTAQGRADALLVLATAEAVYNLPHPAEAHPVEELGRFDVRFETDAQLAQWAAALELGVHVHGPVHEIRAFLGGHLFDLWALAGSETGR